MAKSKADDIFAKLQSQLLKRQLDKRNPNRRIAGFGSMSPRRSLRKNR